MPRRAKLKPKHTPSHPSAPWRVYYRGRDYWFKKEKEAQDKCDEFNAGRGKEISLREVDEYRHCQQLLGGSSTVLGAVRYFLERNPRTDVTLTVKEAADAYLLRAKGRPQSIEKKKYNIGKMSADFGDMKLILAGPQSVQKHLDAIGSDWMRNDRLKHLRMFFRDCVRLKLIKDDPTEGIEGVETHPTKVILTVEDARHLMVTCSSFFPEILSAVAFQAFAGIRTSEIVRMDWSAVKLGKFINIESHVAKTHERRVIDWWPEALTNFLPAKIPESGSIMPHPKSYEVKKWMLISACRKSKKDFKFGQNALRHSFCSFACAFLKNAGQAALLAGQRDINVFFKHYRDYRLYEEAVEYFTLDQPKGRGKILAFG